MPASIEGDDTPLRVVYREILPGDQKKFVAQSNIAESGGGARDLRFRLKAADILSEFFPDEVTKQRKRDGQLKATPIRKGRLYWHNTETDQTDSVEFSFEPPTDAREGEARIPTVHKYKCFSQFKAPPASEGRVFLLLVQRANGQVWSHFVSLKKLDKKFGWDARVVDPIHACANAKRPKQHAASGTIDFSNPDLNFCNGK